MKRAIVAFLVVAVAAVGGLAATREGEGPAYRTASVVRGDLVGAVTASAKLNAVVTVEVGSQLSGQVGELFADFNDEVREGEPLARLDPLSFEARQRQAAADLEIARAELLSRQAAVEKAAADIANARSDRAAAQAQAEAARAAFDEAERQLERKTPLAARGVVSKSELEGAQSRKDSAAADLRAAEARQRAHDAAIQSARAASRVAEAEVEIARAKVKERIAALDQAEADLARTLIRAPMDGVVVRRSVDSGQTVAASLQAPTLFTIARDLRRMQAEADVSEADIGRVREGQRVAFTVDAYPGRTFQGAVVQIRKAPREFENVVTYTVIVSADNEDLALLPGMTATVRIVVAETADVLKVPNAALRFRPPGAGRLVARDAAGEGKPATVWVLDERGAPAPLRIRIGASDDSTTEVLAGSLSEGREVIVASVLRQKKRWILGLRWGF